MSFLSKLNLNKKTQKSLFFCLLPLFGINIKSNFFLCSKLGLNFRNNSFIKINLDSFLLERLEFFISFFSFIDLDLKKSILYNIFLLKSIKSYRGLRHFKKLPLRGQRTKTNSKTVRRVFFSGV